MSGILVSTPPPETHRMCRFYSLRSPSVHFLIWIFRPPLIRGTMRIQESLSWRSLPCSWIHQPEVVYPIVDFQPYWNHHRGSSSSWWILPVLSFLTAFIRILLFTRSIPPPPRPWGWSRVPVRCPPVQFFHWSWTMCVSWKHTISLVIIS